MKGPIGVTNSLLQTYVRYLNSPFKLGNEALAKEREKLLREPGRIYQEPYVEFLAGYQKEARELAALAPSIGLGPQHVEFLRRGLFGGESSMHLYTHQSRATQLALAPPSGGGKNVVVTSGTGSGKTECFFLPIIARLVQESTAWGQPRTPIVPWWAGDLPYSPKRVNELRPAGVRALIVYPLNALVEDQMVRLRGSLASDEAVKWLDTNRKGNRFHFGSYSGRTAVAGPREPMRQEQLRDKLRRMVNERNALPADNQDLLPDPTGPEMVVRWDMQAQPPDVLVTNFSMLNIMLMRRLEDNVFAATRAWLQADKANVFTLVVDELHAYRGTPGTEVALVLRLLLERLGLTPASPQLRIIATSASLDDSAEGRQFLEEFFGCSRDSFEILPGEPAPPPVGNSTLAPATVTAFANFEAETQKQGLSASLPLLAAALNVPFNPDRIALGAKLVALGIPKLLIEAATDSKGRRSSVAITAIGNHVSALVAPPPTTDVVKAAAAGMILACSEAFVDAKKNRVLAGKVHLFFRNLSGLWACSDPKCPKVLVSGPRPVGRLYTEPRLACECGARVLDLYYCQTCGDALLGGYVSRASGGPEGFYLTADFPNIQDLPDTGVVERHLNNYTLFWPQAKGPQEDSWTVQQHRVNWQGAYLEPRRGHVRHQNRPDSVRGFYIRLSTDPSTIQHKSVPKHCPNCGDWWVMQFGPLTNYLSPVRGLRTAFTKVAQVLADRLIVDCSESDAERKLVMFSDNRRETALLARDLEHNHYQDLLRNLILVVARNPEFGKWFAATKKNVNGAALTPEEQAHVDAFNQTYHNAAMGMMLRSVGRPLTATQQAELDLVERQAKLGTPISALWSDLEARIGGLGINPAGIKRWAQRLSGQDWRNCYQWSASGITPAPAATLDVRRHRDALVQAMSNTAVDQIFAGRGRSLEDLGLGHIDLAAEDRDLAGLGPAVSRQVASSVIRILGLGHHVWYRMNLLPPEGQPNQKNGRTDFPRDVLKYLRKVATERHVDAEALAGALRAWMEGAGALDQFLLLDGGLVFRPAGKDCWICGTCRQRHLHGSAQVCAGCYEPLPATPQTLPATPEDFYADLANDPRTRQRLHCEELTGQTDQIDAFIRLRRFRGITRSDELRKIDEIDVLNVTTTMEAGVDIGVLRMVMMANMPPERFNYQQRAGRCGRRGQGLSYVLTFCKGRSHDDYYFTNLAAMAAEPPPPPYLDLRRPEIFRRVLAAAVLREGFIQTGLGTPAGASDSVHGQFGDRNDWPAKRDAIAGWLKANRIEAKRLLTALSHGAPAIKSFEKMLEDYVCGGGLIQEIDAAAGRSTEDALSEALAWEGLLPMFGFPTGIRNLYQEKPTIRDGQIVQRTVDRDIEIAISEFAPGSEIIKDKETHHAVGIAHYVRRMYRGHPMMMLADDLLGPAETVSYCRNCRMLHPSAPSVCPGCGRPAGTAKESTHRTQVLSYPAGFRTDFRPRDGQPGEEEKSYASSGRPVLPNPDPSSVRAVAASFGWASRGDFYAINDNNGNLFRFHEMRDHQGWVEEAQLPWVSNLTPTTTVEERALASRKASEAVVLEPKTIPPGVHMRVSDVGVRSALYSFGFLLQRAAAEALDVDQKEFAVGIRPYNDPTLGYVRGQVYLADTLANGAGYSRHLIDSGLLASILEDLMRGKASALMRGMASHFGTNQCDSSCYVCIRAYQNLRYHGLLDWRLAFDLATYFADGSVPGTPGPEWAPLLSRSLGSFGPEFEAMACAGLPALRLKETGSVALFSHPLLVRYPEAQRSTLVADAHVDAENLLTKPGARVMHLSYFDLVHRPWWVGSAVAKGDSGDSLDDGNPAPPG